jgi:hypothetical protein
VAVAISSVFGIGSTSAFNSLEQAHRAPDRPLEQKWLERLQPPGIEHARHGADDTASRVGIDAVIAQQSIEGSAARHQVSNQHRLRR